jgi:hypothetical protein
LEHPQHPDAGERQSTLAAGECLPGGQLAAPLKDLQTLGIGLRPRQLVRVEELFPFAFPGPRQRRRGGEDFDKGPSRWQRPVLKGFQGCRTVFLQRALELIDQSGAFFDQGDLVAAKQPQLGNERILFGESFPTVAVHAQGVGQTPGIEPIALRPSGRFALPVGFAAHRGNRIEATPLSSHQALAGLHTYR